MRSSRKHQMRSTSRLKDNRKKWDLSHAYDLYPLAVGLLSALDDIMVSVVIKNMDFKSTLLEIWTGGAVVT